MIKRNTSEKEGYISVPGGKVWFKSIGNGPLSPLLILHGGPGYPHDSFEPLEALSDERQVILYDQLGCGNSERPKNNFLWELKRFVEELKAVVKSLNLKQFHLFGHSWGSALATSYTLTQQRNVISLILSGPFLSTSVWIHDANALKKALPQKIQKVLDRHEEEGTIDAKEYHSAALEFYKRHFCRIYPYPIPIQKAQKKAGKKVYNTMWGPTEFYCTGNLKRLDLTKNLYKIKIPVLLTCGRYDEATPETVRFYQQLFPDALMAVFEKSAHVPYVEETDKYLKIIRNFLRQQEKRVIKGRFNKLGRK